MIASVSGTIISQDSNSLIIEANGIGYRVFVVNELIAKTTTGQSIKLATQLVVRDDSQALYGFITVEELSLFNLFTSVSGIGPKIALAILGSAKAVELKSAISRGNSAIFTAISGVGLKTAQRLILELRSKISDAELNLMGSSSEEIITAMLGLGYNMYEIRKILGKIPADLALADKVKEALKLLG